MQYKLANVEGLNAEEISALIEAGAAFRIFKYKVALLGVAFSRISPAILIRDQEEFHHYRKKYNRKTMLYGWWFFPSGPVNVIRTIKFNNAGGIDATGDISLNLQHYDKESQAIEIREIYTVFDHLPRSDFKELKESIDNFCERKLAIIEVYAAIYINVEEGVEPPHYIGIKTDLDKSIFELELRELIYKKFHKFVQFVIFTENSEPELYERISRQGDLVISKRDL